MLVNKDELEKGIKVEHEHTDDDALAEQIALDHLNEFPDYYSRLDVMEEGAKKDQPKATFSLSMHRNAAPSLPSMSEDDWDNMVLKNPELKALEDNATPLAKTNTPINQSTQQQVPQQQNKMYNSPNEVSNNLKPYIRSLIEYLGNYSEYTEKELSNNGYKGSVVQRAILYNITYIKTALARAGAALGGGDYKLYSTEEYLDEALKACEFFMSYVNQYTPDTDKVQFKYKQYMENFIGQLENTINLVPDEATQQQNQDKGMQLSMFDNHRR